MLEIKGLRIRSSSSVKTVLVDSFGIKFQDILSADWRNGTVYLRVADDKIENMILCENDMKPRHYQSKLCIRKVRDCAYDNVAHKYSQILFKINKIPLHWNVNDVVKYFQVSCNAPLRFCYRINKDPDHTSTQCTFVEFIASESANKARNILERNRFNHCLGMKQVEENEANKILQHHDPLYSHSHSHSSHSMSSKMHLDHNKRYSNDIDNNGGTRAFGSCSVKRNHNRNRNRNGRHLLDANYRNNTRRSKSNHSNDHQSGSSLNGDRIKRKLKESKLHRSYHRNRKHSNSSYNAHRDKLKRKRHHAKRKKSQKTYSKDAKYVITNKDSATWNGKSAKTVQLTEESSGSECSSFSEYTSNDSYCSSCVTTDDEQDDDYKAKENKEIEEGEIEMKQSKKLRHITSKSLSKKLRNIRNNCNGQKNEDAAPSLSASPSIASCGSPFIASKSNTESAAKLDRLNASSAADDLLSSANNDKLIIFGYDICSAAEIKQVTKKIERAAQFAHATIISDEDIISIWTDVISFFTRFPKHYVLHLDYVVSLISSLIKYHSYLIPLSSFLKLPISCLLELCTGNSIKIIEEFLNIDCQRFHQQFQNILIHNIDDIVSHNAGADLIKLSFRKLCKASLYNIVQVIDQKNYKQLSKELIPIIKNRQNGCISQAQKQAASFNGIVQSKTINSMTTNIILSPISSSKSLHAANNNRVLKKAKPPPPPRKQYDTKKDFMMNGLLPKLEAEMDSKIIKKRKLNGIIYPPRKKQKIPMDPRLIMIKPTKIVYKRWKSSNTMMLFEWNLMTHLIIRNVETFIDKIKERKTSIKSLTPQNVLSSIHSLPDSFKDKYAFDTYFNSKDCLDTNFYYSLFDVMQIVFEIPDELYTVIEINDTNQNILHKLRSICKEETVLFIQTDSNKPYVDHTFCVCSSRLGIIQIDTRHRNSTHSNSNAFANRLQELISTNANNSDHFQCIYAGWKSKGIYCQNVAKNDSYAIKGANNAFIAYLYLILDICRVDYMKIRDEYVQNVLDFSQNVSLYLGVMYLLFEEVRRLNAIGKITKIKPNLYREVVGINAF